MPVARPRPNAAPPRRSLRRSSAVAPTPQEKCINVSSLKPPAATAATPRKRKHPATARIARASDPGPALTEGEDELSTGLTPMIRRTSLGLQKRRRASPDVKEVHFLPLRQVLDGRVKRRLRRSGLSEEIHVIARDKKKRAQEVEAELERLRAELAAKDDEIHRLHDETVEIDSDRIWDLEQQVKTLKERLVFRSHDEDRQPPLLSSSPGQGWGAAAAVNDPFVDDFMDLDHEGGDDAGFGESTVADFMCSTPDRRLRMSFPTPPTTSPARGADPLTPCIRHLPTPLSHVAVQADLPDPEKEDLKHELDSLQREVTKLSAALESHTALTTRLSDKLAPFSPTTASPPTDLEPRLTTLLTLLSDRTTALTTLSQSLTTLGFGTGPPDTIIHTLTTSLRAARLELEYLAPGECPLPLTSSGAAVLDLLLVRLRALAKSNREADDHIDEYHALELSLRQQLAARVSAMGTLRDEVARMEAEVRARDGRVADLEIGMERAKGALARYARDVGELEGLVGVLERELEAAVKGREEDRGRMESVVRGQRAELVARVRTVEELEGRLGEAVARVGELQTRLAECEVRCAREVEEGREVAKVEREKMARGQGAALALRDARVAELRGEVERVNGALRVAWEKVKELRVENAKLKAQKDGTGKLSSAPLKRPRDSGIDDDGESAEKETKKRGSLLSGDLARKGKRRKHDSGLGFLDEEEVAL